MAAEQGFPLSLPVRGRRVLVAGGGPAAARRVAELIAAGADVHVFSPDLNAELAELADRGAIRADRRGHQPGDLDAAWLAFGCAEDQVLNDALAADAERRRIWYVPAASEPSGRVLILGGARSGKSTWAEELLGGAGPVDYYATGPVAGAGDAEWDDRVREHRERRPGHWRTIETLDLAAALADPSSTAPAHPGVAAPALIDCLSTWLARVMGDCGVWHGGAGADKELAGRVDELVAAWRCTSRRVVAVSNEVGSGVVPGTVSGRRFRDELGLLNMRIAAESDQVWLCTAGIVRRLR